MAGIITYLLIVTLNVNESTPTSKETVWQTGLKKEELTICCLHETHLNDRNKYGSS
jgi:hypothetical protein